MTKVKPFRAVIYNQEKIGNIKDVVCPPYDVISPERQEYFHRLSPYNLIHILLGKDIPGEDKYRRSGAYFKQWLKEKILIDDGAPAIYFYSQEYLVRGEKRMRLGFISLLRLPDKECTVFAHEQTRLAPREDRFRLLKQVKANLSPIFVVFADKKRVIPRIYQNLRPQEPFISLTDDDKVAHRLWRLDDPVMVKYIQDCLSKENVFIADGHHRFEVACRWRSLMQEKKSPDASEESFDYIMAYFTNTDAHGLCIFPVHRLVKPGSQLILTQLLAKLAAYFSVKEIKDKTQFFFLMEKCGRSEHVLGMYKEGKYFLLRLKNIKILDELMPDKPKAWRTLDVSILNSIVFKKILGITDQEIIEFTQDAGYLINEADKYPEAIAFILNPVSIHQVMEVALEGERMPPKSTYFYPKVLSGLVIHKHNEA